MINHSNGNNSRNNNNTDNLLSVNSSTMKKTLRINNRDLARALELKKAELSLVQNQLIKLRAEHQALQQEVLRLRACTNMQSIEDFETEVKRRVDVSIASRVNDVHKC